MLACKAAATGLNKQFSRGGWGGSFPTEMQQRASVRQHIIEANTVIMSHDKTTTTSTFKLSRIVNITLTEDHDEALIVQEQPESKSHDDTTTQL